MRSALSSIGGESVLRELVETFYDRMETDPEAYPLHRTPLKIILSNKVDLSAERMVTGHASDGKTTTIRAQDPKNPEYGSIELVFTDNPVELRQWVINDNAGSRTTVVLGDLKTGMRLANDRFVIPGIGTGPKHNDR